MRIRQHSWLLAAALLVAPVGRSAEKDRSLVYIGTYTGGDSKGIYAWRFYAGSGAATPLGLVAETANPSFLAVDPANRCLYAASEISSRDGKPEGAVSAFAIDAASGKLTLLNRVSSRGAGPAFVTVDRTGRNLLVANYSGGSVAVCPILSDGRLGEATAFVQHTGSSVNPQRQREPHAHSINVSPDNRFAIVADLGLDKLLVYRFDAAKGALAPNDPPFTAVKGGSGPRHFTFHPSGRFAYAINELASTVTAFSYDAARGALTELQTISTLPKDSTGNSTTAEVQVDAAGKFLYGSNRGHDSIAVFAIDPSKGTLTPVEHVSTQGKTPRNFRIDPTGSYLFAANQDSGSVVIFRIDVKTGRLTPTGQVLAVASPVCVKFVPAN
ncbi:MAG: lactonase family protein [Bryobacteraceae bacterium]|jgi:6-phosphogluconolactonase